MDERERDRVLAQFYVVADVGTPSARWLAGVCAKLAEGRRDEDVECLRRCAVAAHRAAEKVLYAAVDRGADPGEAWTFVFGTARHLCEKKASIERFREAFTPGYWTTVTRREVARHYLRGEPSLVEPLDEDAVDETAPSSSTWLTFALELDAELRRMGIPAERRERVREFIEGDEPFPAGVPTKNTDAVTEIASGIAAVADPGLRERIANLPYEQRRRILHQHPVFQVVRSYFHRLRP